MKRHKMRYANAVAGYERSSTARALRAKKHAGAERDAQQADDRADPLCHCGAITALETCPYCGGLVLRGDE